MRAQSKWALLTGANVLGRIVVPVMAMGGVGVGGVRVGQTRHAGKHPAARGAKPQRQAAVLERLNVRHVSDRHERPHRQQNQQQQPREGGGAGWA